MQENAIQLSESGNLFNLEYQKRTEPLNMPMYHYHDSYEIYYTLSGQRNYFIKDRTYFIMKGDLVLIDKNDLHKTADSGSSFYERILIYFKKDFLSGINDFLKNTEIYNCFNQNQNIVRLNLSEQRFVESILFRMIEENKIKAPGYEAYLKILLVELLMYINRYTETLQQKNYDFPSMIHKKVSEIVIYVNNNYMYELTLNNVSEKFFMSACYCSRIFKAATGFTFIEYLNSIRIKEAQRLLRSSKLNATQIAEKVGYSSITNFGRVFKTITGISPLQYRKDKIPY